MVKFYLLCNTPINIMAITDRIKPMVIIIPAKDIFNKVPQY